MKKVAFLLMAGTALFGASGATAQEAVTASITIPEVLAISVNSNTVAFAPPTEASYDGAGAATLVSPDQTVISTRGNVLHDIEVLATTPTFAYTGAVTPAPTKAAGDLEWTSDTGTTWTGMDATTPGDVVSNLLRGVNAAAATVQYRLQSTLAGDPPGDYSLTFVYSVVAN